MSTFALVHLPQVWAFAFSLFLIFATGVKGDARRPAAQPLSHVWTARAVLPPSFEPNLGQADARVRFLSRGQHGTLFLTEDEAVLVRSRRSSVVSGHLPSDRNSKLEIRPVTSHSLLLTLHSKTGILPSLPPNPQPLQFSA